MNMNTLSREVNIMTALGGCDWDRSFQNDWQSSASGLTLGLLECVFFCKFTEMPQSSVISCRVKTKRAKTSPWQPGTISCPWCCSIKLGLIAELGVLLLNVNILQTFQMPDQALLWLKWLKSNTKLLCCHVWENVLRCPIRVTLIS